MKYVIRFEVLKQLNSALYVYMHHKNKKKKDIYARQTLEFYRIISVFLLFIFYNKLKCFNWMNYSELIIYIKKKEERKVNSENSCYGETFSLICFMAHLDMRPPSQKIFNQKRSSTNSLNMFFAIFQNSGAFLT